MNNFGGEYGAGYGNPDDPSNQVPQDKRFQKKIVVDPLEQAFFEGSKDFGWKKGGEPNMGSNSTERAFFDREENWALRFPEASENTEEGVDSSLTLLEVEAKRNEIREQMRIFREKVMKAHPDDFLDDNEERIHLDPAYLKMRNEFGKLHRELVKRRKNANETEQLAS